MIVIWGLPLNRQRESFCIEKRNFFVNVAMLFCAMLDNMIRI